MVPWRATEEASSRRKTLIGIDVSRKVGPGTVVEATRVRDIPTDRCSALVTSDSSPAVRKRLKRLPMQATADQAPIQI